ncbi:MAG: HAD family hydrolase [Actinomycetota bacterium]
MRSGLTVAFDADDTLWHNEGAFAETEQMFNDLMAPWADAETAERALISQERRRVTTYGYGVKSFALSMISTAIELSDHQVDAATIEHIVAAADRLLTLPTVPIDGAVETLATVSERFATLIITKGDLHHQLRRIDEARVARYCFDVEVVAEKDPGTYQRILDRHGIDPTQFVMIGNSVVSDIAPVLDIGGYAIHIPYETTWALETATEDLAASERWERLDSIVEVPDVLSRFTQHLEDAT